MKVSKSYWSGLFGCYASAELPRTNNDLEQLFGSHRYHARRASGRKGASPGAQRAAYVVFGAAPDIGLLLRKSAEAAKDFLVEPGLWLRDIFGFLPFSEVRIEPTWLSWNNDIVWRLAAAACEDRCLPEGTLDSGRLAVIADALEEASCVNEEMLGHLRGPGPHIHGCWVVDLLLNKN